MSLALIIVGHGSTMNPDSSAPTHQHADTIRAKGIFDEVVCCFWKEEPNMREVYEMVEAETIYIVPNFISEGYFCQQVLPRELSLDGPITQRNGRTIYYCDPVGVHANMMSLLVQRADEVAPGVPRAETSLIIVGHGTNLNENSTKAIQDQVKLIRESGQGFASVVDAYMEEAPFVANWHEMTQTQHVVVVPFFIADGLHSYQDIPVLLGIESEPGAALSESGNVFRQNPIAMHGRQLYYSSAIGTEAHLAEVILDQVSDFNQRHGLVLPSRRVQPSELEQALEDWIDAGRRTVGQVRITPQSDGQFILTHMDDETVDALAAHRGAIAAREIARNSATGGFRSLHSAPDLARGWRLEVDGIAELKLALDFFYPAAVGVAAQHERGALGATPLREYLARQTGMYRFTNNI
ncbi:MAG: hypothetical protein KDK97_17440, partial [Verrucomicrobiales bacterium]|nr:hypothetical protein [Verrucomicrobiales bacterium]